MPKFIRINALIKRTILPWGYNVIIGKNLKNVLVDEPRIVAWRKSNKVGIKATAKLNCDLKSGTEVVTGFALRFLYTNTVPSLEQREIQTSEVTIPVFVVLGICDT